MMRKITQQEWKDYNRRMRQLGADEKTWDWYVAYISGNLQKYKKKKKLLPMESK